MSQLEHRYVVGYSCDKRGCEARIEGEEMPYFEGQDAYRRQAEEAGWTFWVSRSQHHFCPEHKPSPGSKMRPLRSWAETSRIIAERRGSTR